MLAVALKDTQSEAIIGTTKKTRCQPLTSCAKTFLINIAYSPIRGVNNLQKLFKVGVMTIHKSAMATAMLLHALQLGCFFLSNGSLSGYLIMFNVTLESRMLWGESPPVGRHPTRISMDNHANQWISMDIHGYPWIIHGPWSMGAHGYP